MVKHAQNILITVSEFLEIVEAHPQSWKRPQIGPISVVVRQYSKIPQSPSCFGLATLAVRFAHTLSRTTLIYLSTGLEQGRKY